MNLQKRVAARKSGKEERGGTHGGTVDTHSKEESSKELNNVVLYDPQMTLLVREAESRWVILRAAAHSKGLQKKSATVKGRKSRLWDRGRVEKKTGNLKTGRARKSEKWKGGPPSIASGARV